MELEKESVDSVFGEPSVVRVKMKPALEDSRVEQLMERGIAVLDFGAGASAESEAAARGTEGGAPRAFSSYIDFTRNGGYAAITNENHKLTVIGYVDGPCAMFINEEYKGKEITEKAFQLDRYAIIRNTNEEEPALYDVLRNYDQIQTMSNITDSDNKAIIYETFHRAEEAGKVDSWGRAPNSTGL